MLLHLYGLFLQLFIVYANDRADIETDRLNTTYTIFSGGSRTLVNGLITLRENTLAITTVIACNAAVGIILTALYRRALALPLIAMSLGLLWLYSFPPVRLSYRGGGEILQMLGVGLVLPLFGYYGQAGSLAAFPLHLLAFILPCQLACAMATALPDEPSDRNSRKHTASVLLGLSKAKAAVIALIGAKPYPFPCTLTSTDERILQQFWRCPCSASRVSVYSMQRLRCRVRGGMNLFVTCAVGANVLLMAGAALLFFNVH